MSMTRYLQTLSVGSSSGTVWVGFETDSSSMSAYFGSDTNKRILHTFGDGPDPYGNTLQTNTYAIWAGIEIADK